MKFRQLIEYNKRNIFLQKSCRNNTGRLVPDLSCVFKKALNEVKARSVQLSFNIFGYPSTWHTIKTNWIKLHCWSEDMLNFDFLENSLRIVSLPHFVYDFSRKTCLILNSINRTNFIVCLPLLLTILVNMCIAIVC